MTNFDTRKGKNQEIRHDLIKTANYLYRLADTLYDNEQIIYGKFKMKKMSGEFSNRQRKKSFP